MDLDPALSNPQHDTVVFGIDRVRVLMYRDRPASRRLTGIRAAS